MAKSYINYKATVGLLEHGSEVFKARITLNALPDSPSRFGKSGISEALRSSIHSKLAPSILTAIKQFRTDEKLDTFKELSVTLEGSMPPDDQIVTAEVLTEQWQSTEPNQTFDRLVLPADTIQLLDQAVASVVRPCSA